MKYNRRGTAGENNTDCVAYQVKTRQKQVILNEMKKQGLRITNQRCLIIDIILFNECTCCKEIYYQANRMDSSIGIATVYRMLKTLEEIGMIDRKNLFKFACHKAGRPIEGIELELEDQERIALSNEDLKSAVCLWMKSQGMMEQKEIFNIFQCV